VAESTSLLTRQGLKALGGSNPLVSAENVVSKETRVTVWETVTEDSKGGAMSLDRRAGVAKNF
jgi:hypothetical protein